MFIGVNDTGDKFVASVSAILRKKVETVLMGYSRARWKLIHKKLEAKNLVSDYLYCNSELFLISL
jgi:hypothetical protein